MDIAIKVNIGILQAKKFIPELLKICDNKNVKFLNRKFKRTSFFEDELSGTLSGENANYVWGFIEGYGASLNLNKPEKKLAPSK